MNEPAAERAPFHKAPVSETSDPAEPFVLTEPGTNRPVTRDADGYVAASGQLYRCNDDVWDFVRPERRELVDEFAKDYAALRKAEQRTPLTPEAVRALPYADLSAEFEEMWTQRAASFDRFRSMISSIPPGTMLDLGAGCGWLAARFAAAGWSSAAVDVTVDGGDGLATARWHAEELFLARAEMDALPFADDSLDLVVCNASLHYAPDVLTTLTEVARVTRPGGMITIMDSPVFRSEAAGVAMVDEFADAANEQLGVMPAVHFGSGFLTESELDRFRHRIKPTSYVRADDRSGIIGGFRSFLGARRAGREIAKRPLLVIETMTEIHQ